MASKLTRSVMGTIGAVQNIALQPVLPASALIFLAYAPRDVVDRVLQSPVMQKVIAKIGTKGIKAALGALLALGVTRAFNRFMNKWALNNWSFSPQKGWDWQTELAVVTGGSAGIGKSITLGLVAKGVKVAVLDLADLPADMANNPSIKYWKCDISSPDAVREAADEIRLTMGHPSLVINNAGISSPKSILETDTKNFLPKIMGVNTMALWHTAQEFVPNMILKNKGHVVTVASMASYLSIPNAVDYSASKAGALAFTDGLRWELKNNFKTTGVMTTCVHPMWVLTNMTSAHADKIVERFGAMMQPKDVADSILAQVFSCRGGHVFVPEKSSSFSVLRALPSWMHWWAIKG